MSPLSIDSKMNVVSERIKRFLLELKEEVDIDAVDYGSAVRIAFRRFMTEYEDERENKNTEGGR